MCQYAAMPKTDLLTARLHTMRKILLILMIVGLFACKKAEQPVLQTPKVVPAQSDTMTKYWYGYKVTTSVSPYTGAQTYDSVAGQGLFTTCTYYPQLNTGALLFAFQTAAYIADCPYGMNPNPDVARTELGGIPISLTGMFIPLYTDTLRELLTGSQGQDTLEAVSTGSMWGDKYYRDKDSISLWIVDSVAEIDHHWQPTHIFRTLTRYYLHAR